MATFINIDGNGFSYNGEEVNFIERFIGREGVHDIVNGKHHIQLQPKRARNMRVQAAAAKLIEEDAFTKEEKFLMELRRKNDEYLGPQFHSFEKDAVRRMVEEKIELSNW
jgi:hypothetical protein